MRSDPGTRGAGVRDRSGFKDRGLPRNWREKWLSRLYLDYRDELRKLLIRRGVADSGIRNRNAQVI